MTRLLVPRFFRMLFTGLSFLFFNVGSAVVSWWMIPRARRRIAKLPAEQHRAEWGQFFVGTNRVMVGFMRRLGLLTYTPTPVPADLPRDQGFVIISNHPSLIDILIIKATIPGVTCLVKASYFDKPHLKNLLHYSNDFPGPGENSAIGETAVLDTFVDRIKQGFPVIVFPEGTRSPRYGLRRFRRGGVEAAIRAGVPIVPLFISFHPPSLLRGEGWYQVPHRVMKISLEFLPILQTDGADARELTKQLKADYEERLQRDILAKAEPEVVARLREPMSHSEPPRRPV
jgi:1-acyl-sn-glycerol-3-phosphate acyltransferase